MVCATAATPLMAMEARADTATSTFLSDGMDRRVESGWGGVWSFGSTGASNVANSAGTLDVPSGVSRSATVKDIAVLDSSALVNLTLPQIPESGNGLSFAVTVREVGGYVYQQVVRVSPGGHVRLSMIRQDGSAQRLTRLGDTMLPFTVAAGESLYLRTLVTGTDDVALQSRLWKAADAEPTWQLVVHDTSPQRLTTAGAFGVWAYNSTGSPAGAVEVQGIRGVEFSDAVPPQPSPAPTSTPAPTPSTSAPPVPTPTVTAPEPTSTPTPSPTATPTPPPSPSATTTPPPSTPTPAPTPIVGAASPQPGSGNTGVPAGTTLKRYDGDLTITTPGTVIDGLDIRGFVTIKAANVTIRRSVIRGRVADTVNRSLISSTYPGALIEDSELAPEFPSVRIDGLKGYGFTARRLNIHDVVDSVLIWGSNTTVTASWLHGNRHYNSDPAQRGGPSHDDNIQVQGGTNIRITDNTTNGAWNSALQVTQDYSDTSDLTYSGNWVGGGGCSVNIAEKGRGPIYRLVLRDNRFDRTSRLDCPVIVPDTTPVVASDNVWSDTGAPITIRRN